MGNQVDVCFDKECERPDCVSSTMKSNHDSPCSCMEESFMDEQMDQPSPVRTKHVSLSYESGEDSEETVVWDHYYRSGDLEIFYQYNPEWICTQDEIREEEIAKAAEVCHVIVSQLTQNQCIVFRLRLEGKTFQEIADCMGRCLRSVKYDWQRIRRTAHCCVEGK